MSGADPLGSDADRMIVYLHGFRSSPHSVKAQAMLRAVAALPPDGRPTLVVPDLGQWGIDFMIRQAMCIGGGTTEIAANVIAERVLKMPREDTLDRDRPFREIPRSRSKPHEG